jgi:hypothetical protein
VREARRYRGAFFLGIAEEDGEFLDGGHGDVSAIVSGQKSLQKREVGQHEVA